MKRRQKLTAAPPKVHHTAEQLLAAEIADLESDIRCAERDGLPEYAQKCREKLLRLRDGSAS